LGGLPILLGNYYLLNWIWKGGLAFNYSPLLGFNWDSGEEPFNGSFLKHKGVTV